MKYLYLILAVVIMLPTTTALNAQALPAEDPTSTLKEIPFGVDKKLEFLKEDIIDSQEIHPLICDKLQKCKPAVTPIQQYYYAGAITDQGVIGSGNYSNTVAVGTNKYRFYSLPFIRTDNGYRTVEVATTTLGAWYEQITLPEKSPLSKLFDPLFIETYAQEILPTENWDGSIRDDTTQYPVTNCTDPNCFLANTADYAIAWSAYWNNAKMYFGFDTSSVTGTVTGTVFGIWTYNSMWQPPDIDPIFYVTKGANADNELTLSDWQGWSDSLGTDFTVDDNSTNPVEYRVTLDNAVNSSGFTKLAVLTDNQYLSIASDGALQMYAFSTSERSGDTYDPYLELTIEDTVPPTGTSTIATSTPFLISVPTAIYLVIYTIIFLFALLIIVIFVI